VSDITIRDIAKMAGVSTTAVSFVLNGREGVSSATRERILEIIRRTGFTPNVHTRRLNLKKSFTIHVVLRQYEYDLFNQFALETLTGIFKTSKDLGYSIMFSFVDEQIDCDQILASVRSKNCDGVILNQVSDPSLISLLQQENIPFVCVDSHIKRDASLPLVEVDYYDAAYRATKFLYENGHTEIGFIGPEIPAEYHASTFGGYTAALKEARLVCNPLWMPEITFSEESAEACIDQLLQCSYLPTAFFCAGDSFAIDTIRCAKARGIRIPEDISIISLDNLVVSRYLNPPLTTMACDKELMGEKAVELLYQIIQGESYEPINLMPTKLIVRNSVRNLRE
jgi:DNA-binding LacI/PurR family transcriptional regulator